MIPSLAFFTAGLLRSKNTLSILLQILLGLVACSVLWVVVCFSLAFGPTLGGVIGNPVTHFAYSGVSNTQCSPRLAPHIPLSAFAFFEMMFACIAPLLVTGAYAERLRTKPSIAFTVLYEILIYCPIAHWVWSPDGWLRVMGVQDFAGGIVLHTSAGAASLVAAVVIGPRLGFEEHHGEGFQPSNLPLAAIGACGLWLGWFMFNGASALAANSIALSAALSTQIAASVCGLLFAFYSWAVSKKPSFVATVNGAIAGMAGITPASGYISSRDTFIIAILLSVTFFTSLLIRERAKIDDALEVSSVHGITGVIGTLAIAFFATREENPDTATGIFYGGEWRFLGVQLLAVAVVAAYSALMTFLILKLLQRVAPKAIRISAKYEELGLDAKDHGERAYELVVDQFIHELHGEEPLVLNDDQDAAPPTLAQLGQQRRAMLRRHLSARPPPQQQSEQRVQQRGEHGEVHEHEQEQEASNVEVDVDADGEKSPLLSI